MTGDEHTLPVWHLCWDCGEFYECESDNKCDCLKCKEAKK